MVDEGSMGSVGSAALPQDLLLAVKRRQETEHAALNQWMLDCEDVLERFEHCLKGEVYDYEENKWSVNKEFKPFINNDGINFLMAMMRIYMHKINELSTFSLEEIYDLIYNFKEALVDVLTINQKAYEIPEEMVEMVCNLAGDQVYGMFKRAMDGGERKSRQTILSYREDRVISDTEADREKKKPKLFGIIPR